MAGGVLGKAAGPLGVATELWRTWGGGQVGTGDLSNRYMFAEKGNVGQQMAEEGVHSALGTMSFITTGAMFGGPVGAVVGAAAAAVNNVARVGVELAAAEDAWDEVQQGQAAAFDRSVNMMERTAERFKMGEEGDALVEFGRGAGQAIKDMMVEQHDWLGLGAEDSLKDIYFDDADDDQKAAVRDVYYKMLEAYEEGNHILVGQYMNFVREMLPMGQTMQGALNDLAEIMREEGVENARTFNYNEVIARDRAQRELEDEEKIAAERRVELQREQRAKIINLEVKLDNDTLARGSVAMNERRGYLRDGRNTVSSGPTSPVVASGMG